VYFLVNTRHSSASKPKGKKKFEGREMGEGGEKKKEGRGCMTITRGFSFAMRLLPKGRGKKMREGKQERKREEREEEGARHSPLPITV